VDGWNNFACASIRGLQRAYLDGHELVTDFEHPETGTPYNPDFAAMARSAGVEGVSVERASDLSDAIQAGIASGRPYLIDANIAADRNPSGARLGAAGAGHTGSRSSAAVTSRHNRIDAMTATRNFRTAGDEAIRVPMPIGSAPTGCNAASSAARSRPRSMPRGGCAPAASSPTAHRPGAPISWPMAA
jgi:hypothetical protein